MRHQIVSMMQVLFVSFCWHDHIIKRFISPIHLLDLTNTSSFHWDNILCIKRYWNSSSGHFTLISELKYAEQFTSTSRNDNGHVLRKRILWSSQLWKNPTAVELQCSAVLLWWILTSDSFNTTRYIYTNKICCIVIWKKLGHPH